MKKTYDSPRVQLFDLSETDVLTESLTKIDGEGGFENGVRFDWNEIIV